MKMSDLARFEIPEEIISLWQQGESESLLPLQELALKRYGLFGEDNLLVQAPTSSGKTFIGEMAAIHVALQRKKVIFLVPLKALAEEKYLDFREKYAPYGIKVIISTRDHREFDAQLESGDFSIAIVVYEKLSQLLVRRPERLEEVALVVADELELLSDPDRGAMVEVLLTRILQSSPRLIGLSAVIGHADRLAEWMEAHMVCYDRRPVELYYGVLFQGMFHYRSYNLREEGKEALLDVRSESPWEILTENLCVLARQGEPCLVFVKAKHESRHGAELLSRRVDLAPAEETTAALRALEPTHSRDALLEALKCGVAFHNADLSPEERRVVEQGFRSGEIKVLVSTSTLALGMNLPARNVFIAADKWRYDNRLGMPWKTPILRSEYDNMGGRAGRYGAGHPFGRSIMIAATPFDFETFWRRYVDGECEPIEPRLAHEPLEDHVLGLVVSRYCLTDKELQDFLEHTLTGVWVWREMLTPGEISFHIRAAVNRAADLGVLTRHPDGRLEATPLGMAAASKGIPVAAVAELEHWISESETRVWPNIDLIFAAAIAPGNRMLQVSLTSNEYEQANYTGKLKRLTEKDDIGADVPINRIRNCNLMPFFEEVRAVKTALFLDRWIENAPILELERAFHTTAGQILAAADHVSWIMDAIAGLAVALGAKTHFVGRIRTLAERVQYGLRETALPMGRLRLNRSALIKLIENGFDNAKDIVDATPETLAAWLNKSDAMRLREWAQRACSGTIKMERKPTPVLIIDDRQPDRITLEGIDIPLQDKQYRLIRLLAAMPGECIPYETIYQMIWGDLIVESNQMHFQKRKLLHSIRERLPHRSELITTIPKRGFTLNLRQDEVIVRTRAA